MVILNGFRVVFHQFLAKTLPKFKKTVQKFDSFLDVYLKKCVQSQRIENLVSDKLNNSLSGSALQKYLIILDELSNVLVLKEDIVNNEDNKRLFDSKRKGQVFLLSLGYFFGDSLYDFLNEIIASIANKLKELRLLYNLETCFMYNVDELLLDWQFNMKIVEGILKLL
jgi:hypothetical protein